MTVVSSNRSRPGYLPAEVTQFVGRRDDVTQLKRLLGKARLVTLTGVGGGGKTRLAQRVATELRRTYLDGVWQVDLAPVTDEALIPYAVATTLGIQDQTERPLDDVIVEFLRDRKLLLLLDNCEHLLDGCAVFTDRALRDAVGLRVLCTSRQPLGTLGEQVWTVLPLACPQPDQPVSPEAQARYPALALFVSCAGAVQPGFTLTPGNIATVIEICHRLDGLPLAIELAAARLRMLSLDQLAAALRDRFLVLATRAATPAWHRTLEAAFAWSNSLCTPAERELWARVSVFADRFELAAAQRVCAGDGLDPDDLLDHLSGLVDKSVLIREEHGPTRYRLLATVREFGLDRLRAKGPDHEQALRDRHLDWYLDLASRFDTEWFGPDQLGKGDLIRAELPNLRAALDYCLTTPGHTQAGLRLAADLFYYWFTYGQTHEGTYWCERALDADPTPGTERMRALAVVCRLHNQTGTRAAVSARAQELTQLARQHGDPYFITLALQELGNSYLMSDRSAEAAPLLEEVNARAREAGIRDVDRAYFHTSQAMAVLYRGDAARAARICAEGCALCREHGDQLWLGITLIAAALAALALDDQAGASGFLREALRLRSALGDTVGVASCLERFAWIAGISGDHDRAARLLGAAHRQWRAIGQTLYGSPWYLRGHEACQAGAREALGQNAYDRAVQQGATLPLDDAIRYALGEEPAPATVRPRAPATTAALLTSREREVAELIAEGLSNKEIAERLVTSRRTAEAHVENILRKLGFTSRTQVASWFVRSHT